MRPCQRNLCNEAADLHRTIMARTKYDDVAVTAVIEGRECDCTGYKVIEFVAEDSLYLPLAGVDVLRNCPQLHNVGATA